MCKIWNDPVQFGFSLFGQQCRAPTRKYTIITSQTSAVQIWRWSHIPMQKSTQNNIMGICQRQVKNPAVDLKKWLMMINFKYDIHIMKTFICKVKVLHSNFLPPIQLLIEISFSKMLYWYSHIRYQGILLTSFKSVVPTVYRLCLVDAKHYNTYEFDGIQCNFK